MNGLSDVRAVLDVALKMGVQTLDAEGLDRVGVMGPVLFAALLRGGLKNRLEHLVAVFAFTLCLLDITLEELASLENAVSKGTERVQ